MTRRNKPAPETSQSSHEVEQRLRRRDAYAYNLGRQLESVATSEDAQSIGVGDRILTEGVQLKPRKILPGWKRATGQVTLELCEYEAERMFEVAYKDSDTGPARPLGRLSGDGSHFEAKLEASSEALLDAFEVCRDPDRRTVVIRAA
jgi:hypothetical protein